MTDGTFHPGLEGVVAFETEIAEPDRAGGALRYRGVDIEDLVGSVSFGNVWGLLVDDEFDPGLPPAEPFPLPVHTGDVRVDVQSALAQLAPVWGFRPMLDVDADQVRDDLARASVMALSFIAQSARGQDRPMVPQREVDRAHTVVERFLIRWRGEPDPRHVEAVDAYWVSAAEHGMNASTFTARVIASTGADVAACLSGAVGAMSGPLHGGAPSRVLHMIEAVERAGDAGAYVRGVLDRGERLMGFGHRVYRAEDPRARVLPRPPSGSAHRASRWPRRSNGPPWTSCTLAVRTGFSPPTSSSGPRWSSTSPRCRRRCSPRCSPVPARRAGRRTCSSRSAPAA
jgi:citrate synthase